MLTTMLLSLSITSTETDALRLKAKAALALAFAPTPVKMAPLAATPVTVKVYPLYPGEMVPCPDCRPLPMHPR